MNREEREKLIEQKKYNIEVNHVHKQWEIERINSDYFEDKFNKYIELDNTVEEDRIEAEYLEMYELENYSMEEGEE